MSRSRRYGTAWETALVDWLNANGFPHAERRAQAGRNDRGDIAGIPGVVLEAKNCVKIELAAWVDEATVEKANAGAQIAAVVAKRKGKTDPGRAYVILDLETFAGLIR